jgi:exosortase/archaeosortase family protein
MKPNKARLPHFLSAVQSRANLFFILAFPPMLLVFFYSPFSAVIPFYGFLLLSLKHQKLSAFKGASLIQEILGVIVVLCSFFAYYGAVLVYPQAAFYSPANYIIYLLGLFLIFFEFPTLKEAFGPMFLIVAATSSTLIADWLKPILSPFADDFANIIVGILNMLGLRTSLQYAGNTPVISVLSLSGRTIRGAFVYECIGVYSMLVFSIILVVVLFEDPSSLKVKTVYSIIGLLGVFASNIVRVTMIFLADYFYGAEVGSTIHYVAGYALFTGWLALFLYVYSKRQTIHTRIQSVYAKTHRQQT